MKLSIQSRKLRADGDGAEHQVALHDLIEVGVFTGSKGHEEPLHVEKRWLDQEHSELEFIVDKKPTRAGIDPYNKLIDRNPEDNMKDVDRAQ